MAPRPHIDISPLDVTVSYFENKESTAPKPVNLLTWLQSEKHKPLVEAIRSASTPEERSRLKAQVPAITPSGLFTTRKADKLITHTGLICLDFDYQHNKHIENWPEVKNHLCNIKNFAYVGLSVSGNGYYAVVPISDPSKHLQHWRALESDMKRLGLNIDPVCKDITRLRFYSYDPDPHFNHHAVTYSKILNEPAKTSTTLTISSQDNINDPLDIIQNMIRGARDGEKHHTLYKASRLAGGYIASNKITEHEAIDLLRACIETKDNVHDIQAAYKTIHDGIRDGKNQPC